MVCIHIPIEYFCHLGLLLAVGQLHSLGSLEVVQDVLGHLELEWLGPGFCMNCVHKLTMKAMSATYMSDHMSCW